MKLSKCANGHFYDSDKYPECPYCNTDLLKDHAIVHEGEAEPPAAAAQAAEQPAAEAAGGRPASNEIHTESPRTAVRGLPLRFIQNPPRGRSRTAAGELEGARPASNQIVRRRKACSSRLSGEAAAQGTPARPQIKKSPESDSGDFLLMLWFTQRSCRSRRERRPAQRPERLRERQRRQPDPHRRVHGLAGPGSVFPHPHAQRRPLRPAQKSAEFSKHHRPLGAEHGRSRNRHAVFYPDAGRLLPPQAGGPRGPLGALSLTRRPRAAARGLHFDAAGSEWGPFFFPHLCPL